MIREKTLEHLTTLNWHTGLKVPTAFRAHCVVTTESHQRLLNTLRQGLNKTSLEGKTLC